ncbi:hypothetical protein [Kitasatospora sp. A2-31]|uniref:hypothetical protein n=1 Tax=Kitasatospora sp. A2-31 TaxID=2916414 RepID=UPI001EE9F02B|nr:hypothetical protein [Kitasatospora sp. A2-31]MCG6496622.1 hypothetical protein [Kitasatospora sp. A2-31]
MTSPDHITEEPEMTDRYAEWTALEVRRPDDVPASTPLSWLTEKHGVHAERMANRALPADFPYEVERGDAGDALAVLALGEATARAAVQFRALKIRDALTAGASWTEVAAALDVEPAEARALLRTWADGQRDLWVRFEAEGCRPFGLDAEEYAAVLALCATEEAAPVAPKDDPSLPPQLREALAIMGKRGPVVELTAVPGAVAAGAAQEWTVQPETREYVAELYGRDSHDGHTGWECDGGAPLIAEAMTPGPGKLGTLHAVIYVCPWHWNEAKERITLGGYEAVLTEAPEAHRRSPWPCGHITSYRSGALAVLTEAASKG